MQFFFQSFESGLVVLLLKIQCKYIWVYVFAIIFISPRWGYGIRSYGASFRVVSFFLGFRPMSLAIVLVGLLIYCSTELFFYLYFFISSFKSSVGAIL